MSRSGEHKTPLDRFLSIFADVKAGEGLLAIIMTLNVFLLLNSYYVLKPIRDALIGNSVLFGIEGDQLKSYLGAVMAFLLIFVVKGYSILTSRVTRIRLLNVTSASIVVCVLGFFVLLKVLKLTGAGIAVAYFVWLGITNIFLVAQFWSFANDIYSEKQGKRLFAVIAIGQSTGAILGAWLSRTYGKQYMFPLLLGAAILLGISQLLYNLASRRVDQHGTGHADATEPKQAHEPLSKDGGFKLVLRSKYLLSIALMILVITIVNTNGEYMISNRYRAEAARLYPKDMFTDQWLQRVNAGTQPLPDDLDKSAIAVVTDETARTAKLDEMKNGFGTSFYGSFYFWVNLCGAAIQMFLVSRLFKLVGVRGALFILPVLACLGGVFFGIVGTLMALRIAKTAENSTDYSLQNTVKQALWLPTSRDEKYKGKAAIDLFFFRTGDALSAGMVALAANVLFLGIQTFALINAALAAAAVVLCIEIYREHKKLVPDDHATDAASSKR